MFKKHRICMTHKPTMADARKTWRSFLNAGKDATGQIFTSKLAISARVAAMLLDMRTFQPDDPTSGFLSWFEQIYDVSVKHDFDYKLPWPEDDSCKDCRNESKRPYEDTCKYCRRCFRPGSYERKNNPDYWMFNGAGYKCVRVVRYGYAVIPDSTDEEVMTTLQTLSDTAFKWDPITPETLSHADILGNPGT